MAWDQSVVLRETLTDFWAGSTTPDKNHIDGCMTVVYDASGLWRLAPEDLGDPFVPGTAAWEARWARYDALADTEAARADAARGDRLLPGLASAAASMVAWAVIFVALVGFAMLTTLLTT